MIAFDVLLKGGLELRNLGKGFGIDRLQFPRSRHLAAEILMCENNGTVDEVSENGHEFAVVARLEVLPAEIIVFGFRAVST